MSGVGCGVGGRGTREEEGGERGEEKEKKERIGGRCGCGEVGWCL